MNTLFKNSASIFLLLFLFFLISCDKNSNVTLEEPEQAHVYELHKKNLKVVNVNGDNLSYLEHGSSNSKTIILLHGVPTSSFLYRNIVNELANKSGFRVIALDLLGFGESDKPNRTGAYTVDEQATRVFNFADAMNIDNFVLGVHDAGGPIGWRMLLDQQVNRITGLLITNTNNSLSLDGFTAPSPVAPIFNGSGTPRTVWSELLTDADGQKNTASGFITEGLNNKMLATEQLIEAYTSPLTQAETYIELFESLGPMFQDTTLNATYAQFGADKPVALLWGKEDAFFDDAIIPVRLQGDFSIPSQHVKFLENAGHYLQEDSPSEYVDFVSTFLKNEF